MKLGFIGGGNIVNAHLRALQEIQHIVPIGIFDINHKQAESIGDQWGIKPYRDVDSLLCDVDSIVIASPNATHVTYSAQAIYASKHVLCEKPMATNMHEAVEMNNLAIKSGLSCCVGLNYRFLSIFQDLKQLINNNELGDVISVYLDYKKSSALIRKKYTWRDSAVNSGTSGALGDLGVHLIDLLFFLFNSRIDLSSCLWKIMTNVPQKEGIKVYVDDYSIVNGRLSNGIYFRLLMSKSSPPEEAGFFIKIVGTKGEFSYTSKDTDVYKVKSSIEWVERNFSKPRYIVDPQNEFWGWADSFLNQMVAWHAAIKDGAKFENASFQAGLDAQRVLSYLLASTG